MRTAFDATTDAWVPLPLVPLPLVPKGHVPGHGLATALLTAGNASHRSPGRTSQGLPCTCTDPLRVKRGDGTQTADKVTAALETQQRGAELQNANTLVSAALRDFRKARASYDQFYDEANKAFKVYFDHRDLYENAFYRYKHAYAKYCRPIVEANEGVKIPCERDWRLAVEHLLARSHAPDCLVGQTPGFENLVHEATPFPLLVSLPVLLAKKSVESAAIGHPAVERFERSKTVMGHRGGSRAAELQLFL